MNVLKDGDWSEVRPGVGDTGGHFPKVEEVVQEFWDYDEDARAKAIAIFGEFLRIREAELSETAKAKGKAK